MRKMDIVKVEWIIAQKRSGVKNTEIATAAGVSTRWVRKLWARYKNANKTARPSAAGILSKTSVQGKAGIVYPLPMGSPKSDLPGRRIHSVICSRPALA